MSTLDRRTFLGTTAAAAAATAVSTHVAEGAVKKGETVRIAVMGVNGRGRQLITGFKEFPQVEIAYICEPDSRVVPRALKLLDGKQKKSPKVVTDVRDALDDKNVDVLVCSAPDHWHALATIWGCQAGKDVYVEKPASHNTVEGRRMVQAARKFGKIVQVGTQRRSGPEMKQAAEVVRSGKLGDVNYARCWINSTRPNIGYVKATKPPSTFDYDLWCGPGPKAPYKIRKTGGHHYHWHWNWDFGTGECGNNGIHAMDVARWGMGMEAPEIITCGGGKYFFKDDQQTPDTQLATFDFDGGCISWEHRTWSKRGIDGAGYGIAFYGSDATLVTNGSGYTIFRGKEVVEKVPGTAHQKLHIENFLDCLVSREKPNADIEIGHRSTRLCHLANIAWRTRSTLRFDAKSETFHDNAAANDLLGRKYRKGFELPTV